MGNNRLTNETLDRERRISNFIFMLLFIISIVYTAFLTTQFWPSGDDIVFARWMKDGITWQNMITVYGVNGRYLGNTLGIVFSAISKSGFWWIRAIFDFVCMISLIMLIPNIINEDNDNKLMYLCVSAFLMLSVNEYASVEFYSYSAGFMNYFVPTLLFITNVCFLKKYSTKPSKRLLGLTCFVAFINCFFIELVTVYLVFSSMVYFLFCLIKKQNKTLSICLFASTTLGLILMFSYSLIKVDARSEYRSSIFSKGFSLIIDNILEYSYMLILSHLILTAFCSTLAILFICYNYKKNNKNNNILTLMQISVFVFGVGLSLMLRYGSWKDTPLAFLVSNSVVALASIVYLLNLGIVVFQIKDNKELPLLKYLYLSIWVLSGVLSMVSPIGWRCFFLIYVLLVIICLKLFEAVCENYPKAFPRMLLSVLFLVFAIYNVHIAKGYYSANKAFAQRDLHICSQMNKGATMIEVPDSVSFADAGSLRFLKDYYYYDEAGDIEIVIIPCDEWTEKYDTVCE